MLLYPGYRATKVGVRIGEFAGVDGESLRFCFDAIVKDSPLAPLELGIEAGGGDELDLGWVEFDDVNVTTVLWRWLHDSGTCRTESTERKRSRGCRFARSLESTGTLSLNFIGSPGVGKDRVSGTDAADAAQGTRAAVADRRYSDRERCHPPGPLWISGTPDYDGRRLPSGCAHGGKASDGWDSGALDLLFIENVGNLVCPTSYDLGEDAKIVVLSVAEGEDKPLKYPGIFRKAELMILNKIDLLPYVPFQPELAREYARRIHPEIDIINTSSLDRHWFDQWIDWLERATVAQMWTGRF